MGYSLKTQEDLVFGHCDRQGWDVVEHFVDPGKSAWQGVRPDFEKARDFMSCTDTDYWVAGYVDRLFRNSHEFCHVDEQMKDEGWYLSIVQMGGNVIDTRDPMGWYWLYNLVGQAEFDSRLKSVRTTEGLAEAKRKGVSLGRRDKIDDLTLRRIKNLYSRGYNTGDIKHKFESEGLTTPTGSPVWSRGTIRGALDRMGMLA